VEKRRSSYEKERGGSTAQEGYRRKRGRSKPAKSSKRRRGVEVLGGVKVPGGTGHSTGERGKSRSREVQGESRTTTTRGTWGNKIQNAQTGDSWGNVVSGESNRRNPSRLRRGSRKKCKRIERNLQQQRKRQGDLCGRKGKDFKKHKKKAGVA